MELLKIVLIISQDLAACSNLEPENYTGHKSLLSIHFYFKKSPEGKLPHLNAFPNRREPEESIKISHFLGETFTLISIHNIH